MSLISLVAISNSSAQTVLSDLRYPAYYEYSERKGAKNYQNIRTYIPGQLISKDNSLYKNVVAIVTGEDFSPAKWQEVANIIFGFDTANSLIKLLTKSDGTTARSAGTEFVISDSGNVGIGTATPDPSAKLELNSTSQGFLVPRMTTAQRDAIVNPAVGLQIINISTQKIEIWNGLAWKIFGSNVNSISSAVGSPNTISVTRGRWFKVFTIDAESVYSHENQAEME